MENVKIIINALMLLNPAVFGVACSVLAGFSRLDCLTTEERKLKNIVIAFLLSVAFGWIVTFGYFFFSAEVFVILSVPMLAAYLLSVVLLYRIIRFLTRLRQPENFTFLHYFAPGLIVAVYAVWMFFVPMEVQTELVKSRQMMLPGDYALYTRIFTAKPLVRLVFQIVYFIFICVELTGYYRKVRTIESEIRKPARWALFLTGLILITVFSSIVAALLPRDSSATYQWSIYASSGASGLYVLLTYHIIRRKYLLYAVYPAERKSASTEGRYRKYRGQLTPEKIETFFRENKPYLNANFKITDLVEALDVNRTTLSNFINKTYGVHFKRYVNQWRMEELNRLLSLPDNENESANRLYRQAGFGELNHYYRAAEQFKLKPETHKICKKKSYR